MKQFLHHVGRGGVATTAAREASGDTAVGVSRRAPVPALRCNA